MRKRRGNVTEDLRTISIRRSTRSRTSQNELENVLLIPVDLIVEILLRLPAKSIARCRCVSKLWGSVIRRQSFTESFLTRSLQHRPQLLFSCRKDGKVFFFSSPQNPDENSSATSLMNIPFYSDISHPVHGLICLAQDLYSKKMMRMETEIVIYNPSTGQSLILPKPKGEGTQVFGVTCFLAYEPVKKQFKVLLSYGVEQQVLTLGTGVLSWRRIECSKHHFPGRSRQQLCINGVLYYTTAICFPSDNHIIVCFDVISEKFRFITFLGDKHGTLINYNGKVASLVDKLPRGIELWILQDAEKQVWSKHTYLVPAWFEDVFETMALRILGVTRTNEIILAQRLITVPFYVFYFSVEKKTMRRVAIQGMEAFQDHQVLTFSNHVENVKLMDHMF